MSDQDTIICRPTKWFLWRAVAMLLMFGVFCVLFMKDWKVGYPKKNVVFYTFQAFEKAEEEFKSREAAGQSASEWQAFAAAQKVPYPEGAGILPSGVDPQSSWPEEIQDHVAYKAAFEAERDKAVPPMWLDYSNAQGWNSKAPEHGFDAAKIREQSYYGIGAGVLTLLTLFYFLRTQGRSMQVDEEAYSAPGGPRIPFTSMKRIDKRKWESKGLAYIFYDTEDGERKKVKVDGMVYGQFREEDGAPAEALFQRVLKKFSGELIELEALPEDEDGDGAPEDGQEDRKD